EPLATAIASAKNLQPESKVLYLSPQGKPIKQTTLKVMSQQNGLILVCGRYEGIDERVITELIDEEYSIGDFVISGGEIAAMAIIDGISRLLPGVLGHEKSAEQDSFVDGLLDYPHYTRPETIAELSVPVDLMNGNHEVIRKWRLKQALGKTWRVRPDLLEKFELTNEQQLLLDEYIAENN
ncbi:MAG: tRNA (guanosine(37)-N1)-methyltransferase TrmD, partial [Pseudomonadota bacterium]